MLYKSNLLTLETIVYSWYILMSIVYEPKRPFLLIYISSDVDDWDRWFLGRAPRTRETLPDFRELCRVTRHSRVFRRLTGSQRTPGFWGVTAWYQSLGIRIPGSSGLGIHHHLVWFDVRFRYEIT